VAQVVVVSVVVLVRQETQVVIAHQKVMQAEAKQTLFKVVQAVVLAVLVVVRQQVTQQAQLTLLRQVLIKLIQMVVVVETLERQQVQTWVQDVQDFLPQQHDRVLLLLDTGLHNA